MVSPTPSSQSAAWAPTCSARYTGVRRGGGRARRLQSGVQEEGGGVMTGTSYNSGSAATPHRRCVSSFPAAIGLPPTTRFSADLQRDRAGRGCSRHWSLGIAIQLLHPELSYTRLTFASFAEINTARAASLDRRSRVFPSVHRVQ
ncbi:hypothetical protein MRX96_011717 [Rhipicephalus microplus]